jgi:hypothetical protein
LPNRVKLTQLLVVDRCLLEGNATTNLTPLFQTRPNGWTGLPVQSRPFRQLPLNSLNFSESVNNHGALPSAQEVQLGKQSANRRLMLRRFWLSLALEREMPHGARAAFKAAGLRI